MCVWGGYTSTAFLNEWQHNIRIFLSFSFFIWKYILEITPLKHTEGFLILSCSGILVPCVNVTSLIQPAFCFWAFGFFPVLRFYSWCCNETTGSEGKCMGIVLRNWHILWGCVILNSRVAVVHVRACFPGPAKNMMSIWNLVNKTKVLYYNSILYFSFVRELEHLFPCLSVVCPVAPVSAYGVTILTTSKLERWEETEAGRPSVRTRHTSPSVSLSPSAGYKRK